MRKARGRTNIGYDLKRPMMHKWSW